MTEKFFLRIRSRWSSSDHKATYSSLFYAFVVSTESFSTLR